MTRLKVMVDRERMSAEGLCPVVVKVWHDRGWCTLRLPQRVDYGGWNVRKALLEERFCSPGQRMERRRINYSIESEVLKIKRILLELDGSGTSYSLDDIALAYGHETESVDVFGYAKQVVELLERNGKRGNAGVYRETVGVLRRFCGGRVLTFGEMDYHFILRFEAHLLARGCRRNTVSFYMRTLRALINRAIRDGKAFETDCPFRKFRIQREKTTSRAVYKKDMEKLKELDLSDDPRLEVARDLFLFSFYTRGMSFKDIAYLKPANIAGGRIYYARSKTGQRLDVKLTEEAVRIIERYRDASSPDAYLFPVIRSLCGDSFRQYKSGYRRICRMLHVIGEKLRFPIRLTTYVARHSWASIAKRSGIPLPVISEGLGHGSEKTTRIYLDCFDNSVLDKANELVTRL